MSEISYPIYDNRHAGRLKPPVPLATRRAVLQRARGGCENCGNRQPLELHHRHYETEGAESPDDLEALCRACHRVRHVDPAGKFWVDPQEMAAAWALFDKYDKED
jgi:5-methylcytosine-specific restriction endonuclease McrA